MEQGRRRIDQVSDPSLLEGLEARTVTELRQLRDACRDEETRLSYTRRLLHAELDVLRAERERRSTGADPSTLIDHLPAILADQPVGGGRRTAPAPLYDPTAVAGSRRDDRALEVGGLAQVIDLSDADLDAREEELGAEERRVSGLRRTVIAHHDALQEELVRRYRDEGVAAGDIVAALNTAGEGHEEG